MELQSPVDSRTHRLLTHEEEIALFQQLEAGDLTARDTLVEFNQRLVHKLARRAWSRDAMTGYDDFVQAGNLGMLHAIDKFDWREGVRFSTYAVWWIRQSISRLALTAGAVPQDAHHHYQERKTESGRRMAAQRRRMATMLELDAPMIGRRGDEGSTLGEIVADDSRSVEDEVFDKLMFENAMALIYNDRQQAILCDYLNGYARDEAGARHGASHSMVWVILESIKRRAEAKGYIMAEPKVCKYDGCNEPRVVTKGGNTLSYCAEHQREYWRAAAAAKKSVNGNGASNGRHVVPPLVAPSVDDIQSSVNDVPPVDVEHSDDQTAAIERPACICDDTCINKRVLDLLLESFPEAREMRDLLIRQEEVLAKIRQLRGG